MKEGWRLFFTTGKYHYFRSLGHVKLMQAICNTTPLWLAAIIGSRGDDPVDVVAENSEHFCCKVCWKMRQGELLIKEREK